MIEQIRLKSFATKTAECKQALIKEFAQIINKYSLENDSNTPDFILANYLYECLLNGHLLICERVFWYNSTDNGRIK